MGQLGGLLQSTKSSKGWMPAVPCNSSVDQPTAVHHNSLGAQHCTTYKFMLSHALPYHKG